MLGQHVADLALGGHLQHPVTLGKPEVEEGKGLVGRGGQPNGTLSGECSACMIVPTTSSFQLDAICE